VRPIWRIPSSQRPYEQSRASNPSPSS
jgi:hypothetical protein